MWDVISWQLLIIDLQIIDSNIEDYVYTTNSMFKFVHGNTFISNFINPIVGVGNCRVGGGG